jgi:hypothetical protein
LLSTRIALPFRVCRCASEKIIVLIDLKSFCST